MSRDPHQQLNLVAVWDKVASTYAEAREGPDHLAYLQTILECVGDPSALAFCEVGCGSGMASAALQRMGARTTLVDIAPGALAFARGYFCEHGLQGQFCQSDGLELGLRSDSFDVVWNGGVIEHFDDSGKVLLMKEMWRIVKPGGLVLIKAPNAMDLGFALGKWIDQRRGRWPYGYEDDLTIGRFRKLAWLAGLDGMRLFAYNPIVGWWFLPYGKGLAQKLGLNTPKWHARHAPWGHVICMVARKKLT